MPKKLMPVWMKILAATAAALLTAGIWILPPALRAVFECGRGLEAQQEGRHSTAIKQYEQAQSRFPGSSAIAARLAISYFHNEKLDKCREMLARIEGRKLPGKLAGQVNDIVDKLDSTYHESGELVEVLKLYGREELEKTASRLEEYLDGNEKDVMGVFHLANINFDIGNYNAAEQLYKRVLELQPEFYSANLNLAAVYRAAGAFEKAEECCNKVLSMNKEHPQAFVALSKLELAQGDYRSGLEYARKACEYDGSDLQTAANLCIAYHYNGMTAERDELFEALRQKGYYDLTALQSVFINNK